NPMWFFQGVQNFKWITILNILSKAIYVGGVFWLVSLPADYVYVNALWGLGMIFSGAMGVAVIIINYGFYWRPGVMRHAMLLVFKEFPLTLSQLFFSLYQYVPVVLVGFFGGDFMAGQYRIIEQVVMVFRTGLQTFFNFVYPQVCSVIYQDKLSGIRTWQKINLAGYALVVMALVVFYWQAYPILQFFKVGPADLSVMVHYFRIALFLPLIMGVTFSLRQLVFAFKRERLYIFLTIGATLVMMALLAWLVNLYGLAAVFATLIGVEFLIAVGYGVILRDLTHKPKVNG
ncbi:MAG TPA: oligosaccharide flippase family protein, partial [Flavobacterium sp.]|nr:oligosaccharide flippase family protein [Flavobacterium sp.]